MEKAKKPKHRTSISVDADLWDRFDSEIKKRLGVRDFSPALEVLMDHWLRRELVPDIGETHLAKATREFLLLVPSAGEAARQALGQTSISGTGESTPGSSGLIELPSTMGPYSGRPHGLLASILATAPGVVKDAILANLEAFALVSETMSGKSSVNAAESSGRSAIDSLAESLDEDSKDLSEATGSAKSPGVGESKNRSASPKRRKAQ